jgi:putative membrane protein
MDTLDVWLDVLGATLIAVAYWLYLNFVSSQQQRAGFNKVFGLFLISVGIYALASGIWAMATWPLPSSYNLVFSDAWPIFGVAALVLGLANYYNPEGDQVRAALVGIALLSLIPFVYGIAIWVFGLTNAPVIAGLMYFFIGLAGILSPFATLKGLKRPLGILLLVLVLIAGIIALFTGIGAIFEHIPAWKAWAPWYGAVKTS